MERLFIHTLEPNFPEEVSREPGCQHLQRCFACGVCTATCPVSAVTPEFSPSRILRQIVYGMRTELLSSPALWYCLGCAHCSFQCPQDVRFLDIIQGLRHLAVREGFVPPALAQRCQQAETLLLQVRRRLLHEILTNPQQTEPLEDLLARLVAAGQRGKQ
ncbi:MAG: 4Fe-4S dicluster domain-containing protein [Desulfobacca sp.]|uniref:4Fe-4S dicluster domain-containing protein n=1 Tax=Desulfobacca sp. TaxID=2067990 RepID=UPI00404B646C